MSYNSKDNASLNARTVLGQQGEAVVANLLVQRGWKILAQNWYCKNGELDIVAQKDQQVLFIEVKTRTSAHFQLSQVITPSKQRKIVTTARFFMAEHNLHSLANVYRFDVALVQGDQLVSYIPNAFTA